MHDCVTERSAISIIHDYVIHCPLTFAILSTTTRTAARDGEEIEERRNCVLLFLADSVTSLYRCVRNTNEALVLRVHGGQCVCIVLRQHRARLCN